MSEHWSCVDCGGGKDARDILEHIVKLADAALGTTLDAAVHTVILVRVGRCATNEKESGLSNDEHCNKLRDALNHALANQWDEILTDLSHGH